MSVPSTETQMQQAGVPVSEPVYADYWGFAETRRFTLPDGQQWIEFEIMNEGSRKKFQKLTNRDINIKRATGDASIKADPAEERHELINSSVIGWNMYRGGQPVVFSKDSPGSTLAQWLQVANPKIVDDLEFEIRKANPWLQAEMTTEEIDKEVDRLRDLRKQVEERELEKARS